MKTNNTIHIYGTLVAVCLMASISVAQEKIADDELLKMIEKADTAGSSSEKNPVNRAKVAIEVAGERAADADAVEIVASTEEGTIDDLGMASFDENTASTEGDLISVRLNKVGLEEAINLFAQLSGANIIVPELTEAAQVSVNLQDVEWRPALQSILDTYNYELYQRVAGSNVFSVRRRPPGAPVPQVVETFFLRYATVPNAAALIRDLLPTDAKVSEFASRNMLVVKSSESSLSEVRSVLQTIDIVRQQVFIESKFMELSDGTQLDLGIDWKQLGLDESGEGGLTTSVGASQQTYADGRQLSSLGPADLVGNFSEHMFTSVLDVDQFSLVLTALESDRGVNVVSNPKLIVANEESANISIVRKEPNLKQERQQTVGSGDGIDQTTFTLDPDMPFFEYGVKLDVTPSINTSSNITISIKPSLTRKFGDKQAGENTYPIIDEKTVETVFNLASGQTAAIGGLTEVIDSIKERKVPLLGSIPYLGRLFSWKQTVTDNTETIIFVTVGLANTQEITIENSLPEDSELARRRMIKDRNRQALRKQSRTYYQDETADEQDDQIKQIDAKEVERLERRIRMLEKEQKKAAKNEVASK